MSEWDFWPKNRQAHYGTLAQYDMWYFGSNEFRVVIRGKGTEESLRPVIEDDGAEGAALLGSPSLRCVKALSAIWCRQPRNSHQRPSLAH